MVNLSSGGAFHAFVCTNLVNRRALRAKDAVALALGILDGVSRPFVHDHLEIPRL